MAFRKVLLTTHLWAGLIAAPFLFALGISGAVLVFEDEIDDAINAKVSRVATAGPVLSLAELESRIDGVHPGYRIVAASFPSDDRHTYGLATVGPDGKDVLELFVDPHTGNIQGTSADVRTAVQTVHFFHTHLLAGRTGQAIVGWGSLVLIFLSLSGLLLWWPAKLVKVGWNTPAKRLVFDLHNTVGSISFVFLFLFAVTGAVIHWDRPTALWLARITGAAPPPDFPRSAPECKDKPSLQADQLLATASAAVPGARPTWLQMPPQGRPVRIIFKYAEDHTPSGRTQVFLAPCTGRVLTAVSSRLMPAAVKYSSTWNREIHTGDIGGWPTRILMCLFSLSLPTMALTGPLIWWTRRRAS